MNLNSRYIPRGTLAYTHTLSLSISPSYLSGCQVRAFTGARYKCLGCKGDGFDYCSSCSSATVSHTAAKGPTHQFLKLDSPKKSSPPPLHEYVQCDSCQGRVEGARYKCELRSSCRQFGRHSLSGIPLNE